MGFSNTAIWIMSMKGKNKRDSTVLRILAPNECSAKDLRFFARLVRLGEQVASAGLEARIRAAAWLGFAWFGGALVGVAALKAPRPTYRDKIFSAAEVATLAVHFPLEFGWVLVTPQFRGLGIAKKLLCHLMAKNSGDGIFATTSVDNHFMHKILQSSGFQMVGQPFPSDRRNATNFLWVRPGQTNNATAKAAIKHWGSLGPCKAGNAPI
jgi:GNAT superfamily N-acetyltransferase